MQSLQKQRLLFILLFLVINPYNGICQNSLNITNATYTEWEKLLEISHDDILLPVNGYSFLYKKKTSHGSDSIVIRNITTTKETRFKNSSDVKYNKNHIAFLSDKSLTVYSLVDAALINTFHEVVSFDFSISELFYLNDNRELQIRSLTDTSLVSISNVTDYHYLKKSNRLVIITDNEIMLYSFATKRKNTLMHLSSPPIVVFDDNSETMVTWSRKDEKIDVYKLKDGQNRSYRNPMLSKLLDGRPIEGISISPKNQNLLFEVLYTDSSLIHKNSINIFTSQGKSIFQTAGIYSKKYYCLNLKRGIFSELRTLNARVIGFMDNYKGEETKLVYRTETNIDEHYWNSETFKILCFDFETGKTDVLITFPKSQISYPTLDIQPDGRFLIYYSENSQAYISYDSRREKYDTLKLDKSSLYDKNDIPIRRGPYGIAGWKDNKIWIYYEFDIWEVEMPYGRVRCITRGIGKKNGIRFRVAGHYRKIPDDVVISGYSNDTKQNGLFLVTREHPFHYEQGAMGNYSYYGNEGMNAHNTSVLHYAPVRVMKPSGYLVFRGSGKESPNIFFTKDFINYNQITQINPERRYKLPYAELVTWVRKLGGKAYGLLYKPVDFDSSHKYPVIFHFYEKRSNELNMLKEPLLSDGGLSIPWYANNGYAVFCPDIYYSDQDNASSIVASIEESVKALGQFDWADTSRLGIQGHSFGGYETLLAISRLKYFKAAQESAGPVDLISEYSFLVGSVASRQSYFDFNQANMGGPPWIFPSKYISHSPLFSVQQINTPLLIMHNKNDGAVNVNQSIEMIGALRREKKCGWLLQYNNEGHQLYREVNQIDFTIKQQDFFNHYLKGVPAPVWMQ